MLTFCRVVYMYLYIFYELTYLFIPINNFDALFHEKQHELTKVIQYHFLDVHY